MRREEKTDGHTRLRTQRERKEHARPRPGRRAAPPLSGHFPDGRFDAPRTREEFLAALDAATREGDFVFASVKGNGAQALHERISLAIWVDAPRETRLQRVRERSFRRFGERMLPGGDLYAAEEKFFAQVASRSDEEMRAWAAQLPWPVLRVDGTRPVQALVPEVCTWISETTGL